MTSRERIQAALAHREPDRTPIFDYVLLSPIPDQLLGRPYRGYLYGDDERTFWRGLVEEAGWEGASRQVARDMVDIACLLQHDMMYVTPLPLLSPPRKGLTQSLAKCSDPVERLRLRNDAVEAALAEPPASETDLLFIHVREAMAERGVDLPILSPAYMHGVWTDVDLMQTMLLEPEVARRHFALATRRALAAIERYLALGIEQIGIGGDFAGNRLLISPQAYREFIVPEVRTLARRIHAAGAWAITASDGNLWPVIEEFLFGCEVDGYLEIDLHAGMELRQLKKSYGDRITLYGNLDCGNILSFGTVAEVRRHTLDCLEAGLGHGGHILCASNAITASVPMRNYAAMVGAYREMFGLPALRLSA